MVLPGPVLYDTFHHMRKNELLTALAAGIRRCRKDLGLTIEELAEAAGMDAGYLAHVETGSKPPSIALLSKIVSALRIAPHELLAKTSRPTADSDKDARRFLVLLRGLTPARRADLLAVMSKVKRGEQIRALRLLLRA